MKKFFHQLCIVLLSSVALSSYAQVQDAWQKTSTWFAASVSSFNPGLVLDGNGNVIGGVTRAYWDEDFNDGRTFTLSKYTPAGTTVFEMIEPVQESYDKLLVDIAVDNAGNIYCGVEEFRVVDPSNSTIAALFAVYKYGPAGNVIWKRSYGDGQLNVPTDLAVDAAGNVYLTGYCKVSGAQITQELPDYLTVKWNTSGTLQWARRYDGASPGEGHNIAHAITVDGSGNVYITGESQLDGQIGYVTIKYNAAGTQLWAQRYNGPTTADDRALAITRDVSGFIYVTGNSEGSIATIKYNNDGAQIWVAREGSGGAQGRAIKVDGFGNVFVGGNSSGTQMAVVKYNFAGVKQWTSVRGGTGYALDIDGYGNSYISGTSSGDGVVLKLNSSGVQQWIKTHESTFGTGVVNPVAVGNLENVFIIRIASFYKDGNANPNYAAAVFKYTQCDLVCPPDMTINTDPGQCTAVVNYEVGVTGECGSNIATSQPSGTALPVGTTIVAIVSLATGEYCSFNVTVRDAEPPQAKCKNLTLVLNSSGSASITAAQLDNGSSDNCGIQSRTLSKTSFTCADVGANTVTLTVTDVNGNTATCNATVTVQDNTPPVARCKNATVYLDAAGSASITTTDIDDGSSDACGAVTLSLNKTSFTCTDKGANTVVLTVTDPNNNTATCPATVTVVDNLPPVISSVTADPSSLWPSDRKMKPVAISAIVTDNCPGTTWQLSDVVIKAGEFTPDNINPDMEITGATSVNLRAEIPRNNINRVYTVTITATDAAGNTSTSSVDVDVSYNITAPGRGNPFRAGSSVNLAGEFWDEPGTTHTAKWIIDNNTSVRASLMEPSGNQNGVVTGSYRFNEPGVYKLQMNVIDQYGITRIANTNENLDAIIIIYDPNGGYTYGGGKFSSQAGALASNPAATGDVTYGFTVNYYKGAKQPKGETQFDFKFGDFEYNALNFDYLAISATKAQFRGTGKIVGQQSGISFIMTVIDGALDGTGIDKLRMKIFNKNTGRVYYDNQPGDHDAADPITPVGDNSTIVIMNNDAPLTGGRQTDLTEEVKPIVENLAATAYPNPFNRQFSLNIKSPVSGMATIEFYTLSGVQVYTNKKVLTAGVGNTFSYPGLQRYGSLFYRVTINGLQVRGIVVKAN